LTELRRFGYTPSAAFWYQAGLKMNDDHLRWLQHNQTRHGADTGRGQVGLGEAVDRVLGSAEARSGLGHRVTALLAECGGSGLAENVVVRSVEGGVLTLEAPDPATACYLGLQWEQRLVDLLQWRLPEAGVRTVRFTGTPAR